MAVNYVEIAEGQLVSSSVANASFEAVRTEVNDLDETSIEKNTLHREHLPSAVLSARTTGISGSDHTYTAILVGTRHRGGPLPGCRRL